MEVPRELERIRFRQAMGSMERGSREISRRFLQSLLDLLVVMVSGSEHFQLVLDVMNGNSRNKKVNGEFSTATMDGDWKYVEQTRRTFFFN